MLHAIQTCVYTCLCDTSSAVVLRNMGFGRLAVAGSFTMDLGAGLIHRGAVCKAQDAWTSPDVNSPSKAKTVNPELSTDVNLAILPVAPVAELLPNVLLGNPMVSPNEAQRGILATGNP